MTFMADNRAFEAWLRRQCDVDKRGLKRKHEKMSRNAFAFLRATYFRWARTIEDLCPELVDTPKVLAAGDLHIENFGTWRDVEGRLVWGINDFDEAARMPYAFDLVRLVTSARLAPGMKVGDKTISQAVLAGYRRGIKDPRPTLLDENETWMRKFVGTTNARRKTFWDEVKSDPDAEDMPASAKRSLEGSYPESAKTKRFATRRSGGGSLGRPRFVACAEWRGGHIVREAKALAPSAWTWAHEKPKARSRFLEAVRGKHRSPDPWLDVDKHFIVRRLAADARKIELTDLPKMALQKKMFNAMGFDLGAFHGSNDEDAKAICKDLDHRRPGWLHAAADRAEVAVQSDFKEWKRG